MAINKMGIEKNPDFLIQLVSQTKKIKNIIQAKSIISNGQKLLQHRKPKVN